MDTTLLCLYEKMDYNKECIDTISTIHERIYPKWWHYHMNFQCHHNSKYYAEKEWLDVASVIAISNWHPIAHFINIDKKWNYIDNTTWEYGLYSEYYLIKKFKISDYLYPTAELNYLKIYIAEIYNKKIPRYKKKLSYKEF